MPDLRPVLFIIGALLAFFSVAMVVPALVDLIADQGDWRAFATGAALTMFIGVTTMLATGKRMPQILTLRQIFLLTTLTWILVAAFAALPLYLAKLNLSYIDAYFETMSGMTTTGSTVITGLDHAPQGVLLWRAMLHWFGGIGIIVVGLAILPILQVGGMQLFRAESSDKAEKVLPRATRVAAAITVVYVALSSLCAISFWLAGMSGFEAICHAMAALATGGFSTSDESIGHFHSAAIEWVATVFMLCGGISFTVYVQALRGRPLAMWRDSQLRWYAGVLLSAIFVLSVWRIARGVGVHEAIRSTAFSVVSVVTTTGFVSADYSTWGTFATVLFFLLLFVGGCTGSTGGGVKLFRYAVLFGAMQRQFYSLVHPHAVYTPRFNGMAVPPAVTTSVLAFFFLYGLTVLAVALGLGLMGLDLVSALSGAATAVGNVGPGLGHVIGPAGNFASLPAAAKVLLSFAMLLGRLELFTVLVIFTAGFWRA